MGASQGGELKEGDGGRRKDYALPLNLIGERASRKATVNDGLHTSKRIAST